VKLRPLTWRGLLATGIGVAIVLAVAVLLLPLRRPATTVPDLDDAGRIAAGATVYARHCAACHGVRLEGQPDWTSRLPNGRQPAPPHDDSGHTWHHPFEVLFALTKHGLAPPHAPAGYESDMPAFGETLSDDAIWNVLAFIRSRWSETVRARHAELQRHHAAQGR
jgi:mono/diheme cytochrome c family protein